MKNFLINFRLFSKSKRETPINPINNTISEVLGYTAQVRKPGTKIKSIEVLQPTEVLPSGEDVVITPIHSFFVSESKA